MTAVRILFTGTLLIVLAGFLPGLATAADITPSAYQMDVAVDRAYGDKMVRGEYEIAIARLTRQVNRYPDRDPFDTATNLCVAYTMTGQFKQAERYCDKALSLAQEAAVTEWKERQYSYSLSLYPVSLRTENDDWAQAYSNRGVLRALTGNTEGAEDDFRQAIAVEEADSTAAARNLVSLHQIEHAQMAGNPD